MSERFRGVSICVLRIVVAATFLGLGAQGVRAQSRVSSPNERARFLAALPLMDASPLKKFEQLPAYREHAQLLAAEWDEMQKKRWDVMTSWAQTEVKPFINTHAPLFYMFGGPDFLNAYLLYPDAPRYILCGLETVGKVPAIETWQEEQAAAALHNLGLSLKPALDVGFFFTKNMEGQLLKSEASGVLPLLYVLIVRTGNEITDVHYMRLTESGAVAVLPGEDPVKAGARGVKITFVRRAGSPPQELYYFRTDLSDKAVKSDSRFLNYLSTLGQGNCYLKAASYLMHTKEFSMIRDLLLSQSSSILEDDTGIPYRDLSLKKWKIVLYGNYVGPISEISWAVQPDLKKAYSSPGAVKPLPFKNSYGSQQRANLLFATPIKP